LFFIEYKFYTQYILPHIQTIRDPLGKFWPKSPPKYMEFLMAIMHSLLSRCKIWWVPNTSDESRTHLDKLQVQVYLTIIGLHVKFLLHNELPIMLSKYIYWYISKSLNWIFDEVQISIEYWAEYFCILSICCCT